jgi:hypothetical protein
MALSSDDVENAQDAAAANAARGAKMVTIGDRTVQFASTKEQIEAARMLQNDLDGGIFNAVPEKKGYF